MDKRFIIAIALVFLVLLMWPLLFGAKRKPPVTQPPDTKMATQEERKEEPIETPEQAIPDIDVLPQVAEETIIPIQTPLYDLQLTTEGARAISWKLKGVPSGTDWRFGVRVKTLAFSHQYPLSFQKWLALERHPPWSALGSFYSDPKHPLNIPAVCP